MASDVKIEFDLVTGKNDVGRSIDDIKKNAASSNSTIDLLLGRVNSATSEAKKISSDISKSTESSFNRLSTSFAIGAASIVGFAYSVKEFVGASIEAEENISRLNVSLKQTGIFTEKTSEEFIKLAEEIQNTTVYSDDQAMSLTATLQNLGQFTKEGLVKATKASIELASAMKIDLNSAATLVGKAASGNIIAFQRMGIEIRKGKTDAETFANTLDALSRFQGASTAEVNTLGGSFKSLGNQVDDAKETLGKIISETFMLKDVVLSAAKSIREFNNEIKTDSTSKAFENIKSARSEYNGLTEDVDATVDAFQRLRDEKAKAANEQRFQTEEFLKGNKALSALLSVSINNLQPQKQVSLIGDIAKSSAESTKLLLDTKARQEEIFKKNQEEREKAKKEYISMFEQIKNAGMTEEETLLNLATERTNKINELNKRGAFKNAQEYADAKLRIELDLQDKLKKLDSERVTKYFEEQKKAQEEFAKKTNLAAGLATNVLQGSSGAKAALGTASSLAAEAFLGPGTGQAVSALVTQLSQGPEANRQMIKEFSSAIPDLVSAIIDSIPVIIEELSIQFPKVVEAISKKFNDPNFWIGFTTNMVKAAIAASMSMPKAFVAQIPSFFKEFGKGLLNVFVDGLKSAVSSIVDAVNPFNGGDNGLLGLGFLGLARGGQVSSVPRGYPNDTFPAMLTSNELVVDRSTAERLNNFLDGNNSKDTSITDALLNRILEKLSMPINVSTSATLNGRALADIILELNRSNARLAT